VGAAGADAATASDEEEVGGVEGGEGNGRAPKRRGTWGDERYIVGGWGYEDVDEGVAMMCVRWERE
jgi:hypothetical protein